MSARGGTWAAWLQHDRLQRWKVVRISDIGTGKSIVASNIRSEADAALIAASPDLLATLVALMEQVERGDFDIIGPDHPSSAIHAGRIALAKARGGL